MSRPPGDALAELGIERRRPDHLHELRRRPEGLLRPQRRHRLHLSPTPAASSTGPSSGARSSSSSRTSTSAATPASRRASRSRRWSSGTRSSRSAATPRRRCRRRRVILWKGYCSVHARFSVEQIEQARAEHPGVNVIVHPECRLEVVQAADCDGSTEFIIDTIRAAPGRHDLGGRHRDQPGQPPRRRAARQARLLPRPGHLPLLDDVPRPPRLRPLDAGAPGARRGRQPDHRRPRHRARRAGRARPHARRTVGSVAAPRAPATQHAPRSEGQWRRSGEREIALDARSS